jgi:hypothetical protein
MDNLWPSDIARVDELRSPLTVLKEQASQLGKLTRNIIVAEVQPIKSVNQPRVSYYFNIVAPALENYRYALFRIEYDIVNMYPVTISIDGDIYKEMFPHKTKGLTPNNLYNISRSLDSCTWFQGIIPFGI